MINAQYLLALAIQIASPCCAAQSGEATAAAHKELVQRDDLASSAATVADYPAASVRDLTLSSNGLQIAALAVTSKLSTGRRIGSVYVDVFRKQNDVWLLDREIDIEQTCVDPHAVRIEFIGGEGQIAVVAANERDGVSEDYSHSVTLVPAATNSVSRKLDPVGWINLTKDGSGSQFSRSGLFVTRHASDVEKRDAILVADLATGKPFRVGELTESEIPGADIDDITISGNGEVVAFSALAFDNDATPRLPRRLFAWNRRLDIVKVLPTPFGADSIERLGSPSLSHDGNIIAAQSTSKSPGKASAGFAVMFVASSAPEWNWRAMETRIPNASWPTVAGARCLATFVSHDAASTTMLNTPVLLSCEGRQQRVRFREEPSSCFWHATRLSTASASESIAFVLTCRDMAGDAADAIYVDRVFAVDQ